MDDQYTFENKTYKDTYRHTTSHILAQAMKRLYPEVKLAIGPAIEDGFYYDFDSPEPFTPEVLEKLEAEMRKICKEKLRLERFELPRAEALKFMEERDEPYKVELINDLPEDAVISFYRQGEFVDLCAGPHLDSTGRVKGNAIKLTSVTGAYWRGDSSRKMLQRIYGTCFPKKEELDAHLARIEEAKKRGLNHEEYHSEVQYVVAHGISSKVNDKKVIIGSAHFVFEDEGCVVPEGEDEKFQSLPAQYSHLYLCIAGKLAAVICIFDPLRREARDAIRALHDCGFTNVVMMTGDNRKTAESVAAEVGVDAVYAEVLPEDKANFVREAKAEGHTVIMVGDGVNDSPALSEADVGIAISTGAAIAREIADITIASEDLFELVTLRHLSEALMARIHRNYRTIVGFNLGLIVFGVAGILPPTTSALLHNASTLAISLKSMTNLLPEAETAP